jgi:hypothetical protein
MAYPSLTSRLTRRNNLLKVWSPDLIGDVLLPGGAGGGDTEIAGGGTRMLGIPVHLIASADAVQVQ